jgi:hypothetical protein
MTNVIATLIQDPDLRRFTEDRPCIDCGVRAHDGDPHCADCGSALYDYYDEILAWKPDPNLRVHDEMVGAGLAKLVRKLVKPLGMRVRTEDAWYVNVTMPRPQAFDRWTGSVLDLPYEHRFHIERANAAQRRVEQTLRLWHAGSEGVRDTDPGADYPYLSLPVISVGFSI